MATIYSSTAERVLKHGIDRHMQDRIVTLRQDGVQEHEIDTYGLAYMVAIMDRMVEIGVDMDRAV